VIKYICDKCGKEKLKEDCFIIERDQTNLLCVDCFKKYLNEEVEIYRRIIIQEFSKGKDIRLEDYIIILDSQSVGLLEGYQSYKKQFLKDVTMDDKIKALVVLDGYAKFPQNRWCPSKIRVPELGM